MAPKAAHEAAKKKAKKQKKVLMVLAVPMLGAAVYAYTTLSSLGASSPPKVAAAPAAATTPATSIPTAAPAAASAASTVTPGIDLAAIGSLHSFNALGRKDPFHDGGPKPGTPSGPKVGPSSSGKASGSGGGSTPKPPSAPLTGGVISINGTKLALAVGADFGQAPGLSGVSLFRLIKVTPKTALIGVVGTRQRFTLHVLRPLTLQQTGGWSYTLILEPVGSAAPMTVQASH